MKMNARTSRRTDADALVQKMIAIAKDKAANRFGCTDQSTINAFALGYIGSQLVSLAMASPNAMAELESAVAYAEKNR
jgi:hypothetical protein